MSPIYSKTGDEGLTGLLGEGRVQKFDLRIEALGAIDEASAALGLVRSNTRLVETNQITLQIQKDLYQLMTEVGATPENSKKFRTIGDGQVKWLENETDWITRKVEIPHEFILSGESSVGALVGMARTIIRRAERRVVELYYAGGLDNPALLAYLNRLSSLCFVLELFENQQAGKSTRMAKQK